MLSFYDDDKLVYSCDTLEEVCEGAECGKDLRVPSGEYECSLHTSYSKKNGITKGKYQNVLIKISNKQVSKNRYILIHIGNTLKDTLGCILLGVKDKDYTGVYSSTKTCKDFYTEFFKLYENECKLNIINDFKE